jgi:hypothetical protein
MYEVRCDEHTAMVQVTRNAYVFSRDIFGKRPLTRKRRGWTDYIKIYIKEIVFDEQR